MHSGFCLAPSSSLSVRRQFSSRVGFVDLVRSTPSNVALFHGYPSRAKQRQTGCGCMMSLGYTHPSIRRHQRQRPTGMWWWMDRGAHRQSINPRLGFHISWLLPKFVHQSANKSIRFLCLHFLYISLHFFQSVCPLGKMMGLYFSYFSLVDVDVWVKHLL